MLRRSRYRVDVLRRRRKCLCSSGAGRSRRLLTFKPPRQWTWRPWERKWPKRRNWIPASVPKRPSSDRLKSRSESLAIRNKSAERRQNRRRRVVIHLVASHWSRCSTSFPVSVTTKPPRFVAEKNRQRERSPRYETRRQVIKARIPLRKSVYESPDRGRRRLPKRETQGFGRFQMA